MSFSFKWDAFAGQQEFQSQIRELLTNALNKNLPKILEDRITVLNLDWGNEAPTLEMLEIGDVAMDRFRGVFKLNYTGGATITVATKVQANLLNVYQHSAPANFTMPKFVDANASFPIPLHLTLRNIKLQGTVIVVFSKSKGLTLVFRNDPLQSIKVSSTFDKFPAIASFLQQQIETQIRGLFREEVPAVLYQLSLKYLPSYSQAAMMEQAAKSKNAANVQPVSFADIEAEKPVSLVNMLHVEAMLSSRRTLALETPVMPTAIVRSELHHRALLSRMKSPVLNLIADDQNVYDQLYIHAKYTGMRSAAQKPPKRRIIKLGKKNEAKVGQNNDRTTPTKPLPKEEAGIKDTSSTSHLDLERPSHDTHSSTPARSLNSGYAPSATPLYNTGIPITVRVPVVDPAAQCLPAVPFIRDSKGMTPLSFRPPQHLILPHSVLHNELEPLPVHEIDELPPAYVA